MNHIDFLNAFKLESEEIYLSFLSKDNTTAPDNGIPTYSFSIILKHNQKQIGGINFRAGYNDNICNFRGNIGFTIFEEFRGNSFAYKSCLILVPFFDHLQFNTIWLTCNLQNHASKKTILKLKSKFIGTKKILKESPLNQFYGQESKEKLLFKWSIKES